MSLISSLTRLSLQTARSISSIPGTRSVSTSSALRFHVTPCLLAEPLKKKKRIDPAIIKQREDRKKKKIEKQIRKLEKNARQLKPIEECEVPVVLVEQRKERERKAVNLSTEMLERRVLLEKKWAGYKHYKHLTDMQVLDRIVYSQQRALDELRKESEDLYQEAIQIDLQLIPYTLQGPVNTPAIKNYDSPDGDYLDLSKKWN